MKVIRFVSVHPLGRKMEFKGGAESKGRCFSLFEGNRLQESTLCLGDSI